MEENTNVNEHFKKSVEDILPANDERTPYQKLEEEIKREISNYEYFQQQGLQVNLFKHSEGGKDSTCIMCMKKDKVLYKRMFEGYTDELRYVAYFFFYRDIFNQGLMMMDRLAIEQTKLDKEKSIIEKVQDTKIIDINKKY